ncbi:MAG: WYL domain-containing protein [Geodermatophilaceae bacterium]|nr:WYL domain-containing protein [Geodermatophilaceae bacterium]
MISSSARLLQLLGLLQRRQNWSGPALADALGITERTVRRDVDKLRTLGYPVHATSGTAGGYQLAAGADLPPLLLDDDEAVAVAVGLRAAALGTVTGLGEASLRALAKLDRVLPARLRPTVSALSTATVPLSAAAATVDSDVLIALAAACRDSRRVRFDYTARDGDARYRRVEPHRLVNTGTRWYLVARDEDRAGGAARDGERADWRSFRVDRIRPPLTLAGSFVPMDPPEAAGFVAAGITSAAYPYQATIRLLVPLAEAARLIPPTAGTLVADGEQAAILTIGANSPDHLAIHLGLLDCAVDVLDPPELRAHLRRIAARLERAADVDRAG